MKSILKLIIAGIIAVSAYKYMEEKEIRIADKVETAVEWINGQLKSLQEVPMQNNLSIDDNTINEISAPDESTEEYNSSQSHHENITERDKYETRHARMNNQGSSVPADEQSHIKEYNIIHKKSGNDMILRNLDSYALNTPAQVEGSVKDLVDYLTSHASNDLEKARLIFTWVATHIAYDDHGFNTGDYAGCSAEEVLENKVSVCEGYSNLFEALGNAAGIKTVKISGYSKGIGYSPGDRIKDTNHSWNAMMINNEWRLMDVTWAAGYGRGVNGRLVSVKQFEDYWFNTSPEEFIFTHLPADDSWQLIDKPVSGLLFERMPYASSDFFKLGFNGAECLPGIFNGSLKHLPTAYNIDSDLVVVSMPSEGVIESGLSMKLVVKSKQAKAMAIKNNNQWIYFEKKEDQFTLILKPQRGEMKLMADFKDDGLPYHTILKYRVE